MQGTYRQCYRVFTRFSRGAQQARNRLALARCLRGRPGTVNYVLSNRQIESFSGLNAGMSGQILDLVQTQSLDNPVA